MHRSAGQQPLDVGAHGRRALVAILDPLGQRLHHDGVDLGGQVWLVC